MLLGVGRDDGEAEADRLASKLLALRVFDDGEGRMSRSVRDAGERMSVALVNEGPVTLIVEV